MELKFYRCAHCGNIIAYAENKGVSVYCCGEKMTAVTPNTTDAAQEKHLPVVTVEGNRVTVDVGSVSHPMTDEHHIGWVCLQTAQGNQRKCLTPGAAPKVEFMICDGDKPEAVYAYCNLHGLWQTSL